MKISVAIITFNEEANIVDCLKSVDFCDEVVLVDSLSSDQTLALARKTAAESGYRPKLTIHNQKFLGHIQQKNLAIQKASNEWVLSLDADERVSPEMRKSIEDLALGPSPAHDCYAFNRRTWYILDFIKHSGWYPDRKVRLFRKGAGHWDGENPHDFYNPAGHSVGRLAGDILHYSFHSLTDHIKTIESFTTIGAKAAYEKGRRASLFTIWARSIITFVKMYFFKLGFLDGRLGFILAGMSAFHTWSKYSKLWILGRQSSAKMPDSS